MQILHSTGIHYFPLALDLLSHARGFALLHLPKMPELKAVDTTIFDVHPVVTHDIPYREERRERVRQMSLTDGGGAKLGKW